MSLPNEEQNDTLTELTNDELAFMTAYFECNANGTRAWMKLHPEAKYESAKAQASAFLTNINLKAHIRRVWRERAMDAEEAIARMAAIAKADLHPFIRIDDDGFTYFNFADPQAQEFLFLIKKMKTKRERRVDSSDKTWEGEWVEVELHDAYTALRDIAKMHGKLTDRVDLTSGGEKLPTPTINIYIPDNGRNNDKTPTETGNIS